MAGMNGPSAAETRGRPPLEDWRWNWVLDLLFVEGKTPQEVTETTGVSQTKVYEIRRIRTRKPGPSGPPQKEDAPDSPAQSVTGA